MNDAMSINVDGSPGLMGRVGQKLCAAKERANASIVSMNCQDAAAAGARAMAIDAGGEAKARAAAQTIAGGGSTVSFAANANSVTVVVRCPVAADPTGVLPASVVGKATRYF